METYLANGFHLKYQVRGDGEPLLLIHGGMIADSFEPIAGQLAASYRVITYPRRGYHGTPPHEGCTMSDVVGDALALLDHLDIVAVHVAGHSIGAVTALQLALDAPRRAHTLALFEPCVNCVPSAADFGANAAYLDELLQSGQGEEALIGMLTLVGGNDPVQRLDNTLSAGWFDQVLADFPAAFDTVVANCVVHHLACPDRVLGEVRRVLRDGGKVAFTVWSDLSNLEGFGLFFEAVEQDADLADLPRGPLFGVAGFDALDEMSRDAGFRDTSVTDLDLTWRISSIDTFVEVFSAWAGLDAYPEATRTAIEKSVRDNAQALAADGDLRLPNPAILLCGYK